MRKLRVREEPKQRSGILPRSPVHFPPPLSTPSIRYQTPLWKSTCWPTGPTKEQLSVDTDLASGSCTGPVQVEGYQSLCHSWEILSVQVTETATIHLQSWCLPTMHLNRLVTADLSVHFQKLINTQKYSHRCWVTSVPQYYLNHQGFICLEWHPLNYDFNIFKTTTKPRIITDWNAYSHCSFLLCFQILLPMKFKEFKFYRK